MLKDQLCKIHFQNALDKNGNVKYTFDIGLFCYLRHEIRNPALGLIVSYVEKVNIITD